MKAAPVSGNATVQGGTLRYFGQCGSATYRRLDRYFLFFFIGGRWVRSLTTDGVASEGGGVSAAARLFFFPVRLSDIIFSKMMKRAAISCGEAV